MANPTHRLCDAGSSVRRRPPGRILTLAALAGALALGCASSGAKSTATVPPMSPTGALMSAAPPPQAVVTACYDCHSDRGGAAWNAKLAPSYWFSGSAAKDLNFSDWAAYAPQQRIRESRAIAKAVSDGSMPPWDYTLLHPAAKLTDAQKAAIVKWTSEATTTRP